MRCWRSGMGLRGDAERLGKRLKYLDHNDAEGIAEIYLAGARRTVERFWELLKRPGSTWYDSLDDIQEEVEEPCRPA